MESTGFETQDSGTERSVADLHKALHSGTKLEHTWTTPRPIEEAFTFCRDLCRSLGSRIDVIAEIRDRMISWQSTERSPFAHAGSIWFSASKIHRNCTEIHLHVMVKPPILG